MSFLLGPLGYALLGKWALAVLCLLTLNWFLLGFFTVPIHTGRMIDSARRELDHLDRLEE